jgi:uroporphyrinogen-III synthase
VKSTKQSAATFFKPTSKSSSIKKSANAEKAPKAKSSKDKSIDFVNKIVEEIKKPIAKLADLLKPKNEKNYADFISNEPKTKIKNILVAQPKPEGLKSPYFDLAAKYKVNFQFTPFITVEGIPGRDFRKQRITLNDYSGIIFTSRNAIDHFFRVCDELRVKMSQETKYFCTSEAIALYLQKYMQYRKRKVFFGDSNTNKELRALLLKHRDAKCLYICPEVRSKDEITSFMADNGIFYTEAIMYRTVPSDLKSIDLKKFDMMILFSPSSITSIHHSFPKFEQGNLKIGAYGKTTADALIDAKLKFHLMAPLDKAPSIIVALENYIKEAK